MLERGGADRLLLNGKDAVDGSDVGRVRNLGKPVAVQAVKVHAPDQEGGELGNVQPQAHIVLAVLWPLHLSSLKAEQRAASVLG